MKNLFVCFVIMLSLAACSKKDPQPSYSSIIGSWKFSTTNVSGQFDVVDQSGTMIVNSGSFTINGTHFTVNNKFQITGKYQIGLQSTITTGSHLAQIFFNPAVCNSSYTSMTCSNWQYQDGTNSAAVTVTDAITITR